MPSAISITSKALRTLTNGSRDKWIADDTVCGSGALSARLSAPASNFYLTYTNSEGKKKELALGTAAPRPTMTA